MCQTITAVDVSKSAVTLENTGNYHLMILPEPSVPMPEELRSAEFSPQPSAGTECRARNGLCTVSRVFSWRPARGKKKIVKLYVKVKKKMPRDVVSCSRNFVACFYFLQALRAGVLGCACALLTNMISRRWASLALAGCYMGNHATSIASALVLLVRHRGS